MSRSLEKKFIIQAPVIGEPHYWSVPGKGNTPNLHQAHRYGEKQAKALLEKEPLLKLIPA